jgi:hypothetical protein
MVGVLNEYTKTVHKHETGASALHTVCGVTYNVSSEQLRTMSVTEATADHDADKCGRCFDDGGSY